MGLGENASNVHRARGEDERQTPVNEWIQKYACNLWMTSFPLLNLHTSFYSYQWKPHDTVPWLGRSVPTTSAQPAHLLLPNTHCRRGTGHMAVPSERCYQQQEEYCFGMPCMKLLAKAPASLLNAAALGRRAGCSSSECGSSHWWWQCRGAVAHPRLSVRGKNSGLLIQQSGPSSRRLGGRAQAVPPPSLPWWLGAHLPGDWPPKAAAAVRRGVWARALKVHIGGVTYWLPMACNFGKMGAGHSPSRNGVPAAPHLAW